MPCKCKEIEKDKKSLSIGKMKWDNISFIAGLAAGIASLYILKVLK